MWENRKASEGKTYGKAWMHRILVSILRHVHINILYVFSELFIIPITLITSTGARLTYSYFHYKRHLGICRSIWNTYQNHILFGQTVIDKFAMFAGSVFKINYHGIEEYRELTRQKKSFVQVSAHIGCSEIVGYSYENEKTSNILAFGGEKESIMNQRSTLFNSRKINMIPVGIQETHSEDIIMAINRGEIVHAFADRIVGPRKTIYSSLFGNRIKLAKSPFSLAVTRGLEVAMVSAMKESDNTYSAYIKILHYDKSLSKREQCQQLADAYVEEIENLLNKYPLQWFNYSNIWS